jgi:predicted secreted protein
MDTTTGKEFIIKDYFYLNDNYYKTLGKNSELLLDEKCIYFRKDKNVLNEKFNNFVKYSDFAKSLNIVNVARYLPVVKITEQAKNNTVVVSEGDFIAIKLESDRSSGMNWAFESTDKENIFEVGRSYLMSRMEKTDAIAKPDYDIIFIEAKNAGKYKALFTYKHAWEKFVEPNLIVNIVVEENK